ncbi:MAG TPA: glycosyltransferase 87 family protein [Roseiflexaceae bacterium]|nr:glycosyltransferase 87 family protein [Roseiflexaceae bacterium]
MTDSRRLTRLCVAMLAGYVGLFLTLHWPFRETVLGVLGVLPGYLPAALPFHPLRWIAEVLRLPEAAITQVAFVVVAALLFTAYLRALALLRNSELLGLRALLGWTTLFGLPLLITPFLLSSDIFSYIVYGRLGAVHGLNPTVTPPSVVPSEPFLAFLPHWHDTPSIYGPLWNVLGAALALLAQWLGGAVWLTLLLFKLQALGLHLACAALVWSIAGRWWPEQRAWAAALYAWNPLALIETAGSAHNDILMVALLLLGVWLAQRNRWRAATLAFALAALAKYFAVLVLPVYAVLLLRSRAGWRAQLAVAAQMAGLALVCAVALYAPFWAGGQVLWWLSGGTALNQALNSPYMLTERALPPLLERLGLLSGAPAEQLAIRLNGLVGRAVMLIACLLACAAVWRRPSFERFIQSCFGMLLAILLLGLPWFWPWYVLWGLALAPFAGWRPARHAALLLSASSLAIYLEIAPRPLFVFGPPLALLLVATVQALLLRRGARQEHPADAAQAREPGALVRPPDHRSSP